MRDGQLLEKQEIDKMYVMKLEYLGVSDGQSSVGISLRSLCRDDMMSFAR